MKKLMIATAALCAAVGASALESANIVGYSSINDEGNFNPGIGGLFIPVSGGSTYKLSSIKVSADGDFMVPNSEYLQELNPNGSAVIARYTYVSEAFLEDEFEDEWEQYKWAVGWWAFDRNGDIVDAITDHDTTNKLDGEKDPDIEVGTAFLGSLNGNNLNFTSAGEVPSSSTSVNDNGNFNPFFLNYLPTQIDLMDITVSADGDFMVPNSEYLQVLNPNGSAVIARYTYVSAAFLEDEFENDWEQYSWAIGWWNFDRDGDIVDSIESSDKTNQISRGDVMLDPGASFLGSLNGNGLDFNFPAAVQ